MSNSVGNITRSAERCNNGDDLANFSLILAVLVFSEVYLEPSQTSVVKLFAKISKYCLLFFQRSSIIDARLSFKYGSTFRILLLQTLLQHLVSLKYFPFFEIALGFRFGKKYTLKTYSENF